MHTEGGEDDSDESDGKKLQNDEEFSEKTSSEFERKWEKTWICVSFLCEMNRGYWLDEVKGFYMDS